MKLKLFTYFFVWGLFNISFGQDSTSIQENVLLIKSDPSGASVKINSVDYGKTPLILKDFKTGTHNLVLEYNGQIRFHAPIIYQGKMLEKYIILDEDSCLVSINTEPSDAAVLINDHLYGYTPLEDIKLSTGLKKVKIQKENYITINQEFYFNNQKYHIHRKLEYKYGFLKFKGETSKLNVYINDTQVPLDVVKQYRLPVGNYNVEIESDEYHKKMSKDFYLNPSAQDEVYVNCNVFTLQHVYQSFVIPGFGQFYDKSELKGSLYFAGFIGAALLFFKAKSDYNITNQNYLNAKQDYLLAQTEEDAIHYNLIMDNKAAEVNKSIRAKNLSLSILIGIYCINLADAFLFHSKGYEINIISSGNTELPETFYEIKAKIEL